PDPPLAPCARSKSLERSATARRSARPHTHSDVGRLRRPLLRSAVEFRPGDKSRRLAQDLVCAPQIQFLTLQLIDARLFRTLQTGAFAVVTFGLPYPFTQGLRSAPDLARNRVNRRPLRFVFRLVLKHHSYRTFPNLR